MSEPESDTEGETITTHELLERSARAALDLQREDGSFPPGRNGVYDEPETPVRTTSHWLTTLSKVYEITGDEVFAEAAHDAADYLLSDEARPHGYTFHSRNAEGKDKCDGLVGQAAPIRGLAWAGSVLDRSELLETAEAVFSLHPFDERLGLWERVEIDGTYLSFDRTLNHQLLFAASAVTLAECYDSASDMIRVFLDGLKQNFRVRSDGLIKHFVRPHLSDTIRTVLRSPHYFNLIINEAMCHYYTRSGKNIKKEIGYHPVNIDGLARLKRQYPTHSLWSHEHVKAALDYILDEENVDMMLTSNAGSNIPAIRLARGYAVFHEDDSRANTMVEKGVNNEVLHWMRELSTSESGTGVRSAPGKLVGLPNYDISITRPRIE